LFRFQQLSSTLFRSLLRNRPIELSLHGGFWNPVERAYLEHSGQELQIEKSREKIEAMVLPDAIDRADTIIRLEL